MKVTREITRLEHSAVKLSMTVGKDEVAKAYAETVGNYAKNLQLPGFRKGKVPVSVLERKFGDALKAETTSAVLEKALQSVFEEMDKNNEAERPLPYSQPELDGELPQFDAEKDMSFAVVYDILPKIGTVDFSGIEVKEPQVEIGDAELEEELQAIRERNAVVLDKKDNESAEKGDIVTINYSELDEKGSVIGGSAREGFVFTIGSGENIYKIDDEIIGLKKDETKIIEKTYKEDDPDKDLAGKTKKISVKITALKIRNLPELDDELAQDVSEKYKTLDDMKNDIRKNLRNALENRTREIKTNSLIEQLIERNPIDLPKSMIKAEEESRWRMMAQQYRMTPEQLDKMMSSAGQKKEDLLKEMAGDSEKMLKGRIIIETLLKERNISVSPEEIDAEYEKIAESAGISAEEVKKHYADPHRKEYLIDDVKEQKLYTELFGQIKITKGEKKSFADLFKN
ncbi:MAG: trigger factor [Bacteroides sp.]|nr:trigger factor [Prevotella sp.]MCM1407464.1 trigger factor [Treponema brennaborense]MCM1469954.1 trigger factor [Bacteroides sp.]